MPNLPIIFIACRVFEQLLAHHIPADLKDRVTFLDYGLHANPKNLRKTLQAEIDSVTTPSLIVLGYGLCGNGLKDIQSGIHTLLLPKTEDCIAIFLGSDEAYRREFNAHPGTYYLTGGWLEAGSDPLKEYEKYVEKYGQKNADFVMDNSTKLQAHRARRSLRRGFGGIPGKSHASSGLLQTLGHDLPRNQRLGFLRPQADRGVDRFIES